MENIMAKKNPNKIDHALPNHLKTIKVLQNNAHFIIGLLHPKK
jgi:hypothetical protein